MSSLGLGMAIQDTAVGALSWYIAAKALNRSSAEGALVVALLDPTFEAISVEVVARVAPELGYYISWLVINQAYYAVGLVYELVRVVLSTF